MERKTTKMLSSYYFKQSNLSSNLSLLLAGVQVTSPSVTRRGDHRLSHIPFEKCNMFSLSHHSSSHHDGLKYKAIYDP